MFHSRWEWIFRHVWMWMFSFWIQPPHPFSLFHIPSVEKGQTATRKATWTEKSTHKRLSNLSICSSCRERKKLPPKLKEKGTKQWKELVSAKGWRAFNLGETPIWVFFTHTWVKYSKISCFLCNKTTQNTEEVLTFCAVFQGNGLSLASAALTTGPATGEK